LISISAAQHPIEPLALRVGAATTFGFLIASEAIGISFGQAPVRLTTMGAAAAVAVVGPRLLDPVTKRLPRSLVAVGLGLVALVLIRIVIESGQLGHDEAAYALKARAWLFGTPDTGWDLHRGVGQSAIAAAVLPFSQSPLALRGVAVVFALGTVVALWALGREVGSSGVGLLAAGTLAVAPTFLRRGAEFLTDLPSAGLLFVVALLVWRWLEQTTPSGRLLYAATGIAAIAYYIRYQSILSLGLLALAAAAAYWPRVRDRIPQLARAVLLGVLLLVPHFAHSVFATGTPWGILLDTAGAGGREYLGEGLVDYARDLPDLLAGQAGALLLLVGLGWGLWCLTEPVHRARAVFLLVPAIGQFVLLGLLSHGEPRFVFFPVGLLLVAGALAVDQLRMRLPLWTYQAGVWIAAFTLLGSLAFHGQRFDTNAEARGESLEVLVQVAEAVAAESGERCAIVTGMLPQMTWLS